MRRAVRGAFAALLVVGLGLIGQGCAESRSGRVAEPGDTPNFQVTNHHVEHIHLYVDGGSIADVGAGETKQFVIKAGYRTLELREAGSTTREWQGNYDFSTSLLTFSYDPSVTENLSVTNDGPEDVVIYVDGVDLGTVRVNRTRTWLIKSGRRSVHAREDGDLTADYIGDFNFNTSELVQLTYR